MKTVVDRNILIVDDDIKLCEELYSYFSAKNNRVTLSHTLKDARIKLGEQPFDCVILDMILPDGMGLELFDNPLPPTVILSTLSEEYNMLDGFSAGAIDYVIKPCSSKLLEARLSLRLKPSRQNTLSINGLEVNATNRTATYNQSPLQLTGAEFNILWFLMNNAGSYFDVNTIYKKVWNMPSLRTNSVKYHISNLRRKLISTTGTALIVTQFGKGYAFLPQGAV